MPCHTAYIAGLKFRPGAAERLAALPEGAHLALVPDPGNIHDPNAVKVLDTEGVHLGYVPRDLAPDVAALIRDGRIGRAVKGRGTGLLIYFDEPAADAAAQ